MYLDFYLRENGFKYDFEWPWTWRDFKIWVEVNLTFQDHSKSNLVRLDSQYVLSLVINNNMCDIALLVHEMYTFKNKLNDER